MRDAPRQHNPGIRESRTEFRAERERSAKFAERTAGRSIPSLIPKAEGILVSAQPGSDCLAPGGCGHFQIQGRLYAPAVEGDLHSFEDADPGGGDPDFGGYRFDDGGLLRKGAHEEAVGILAEQVPPV